MHTYWLLALHWFNAKETAPGSQAANAIRRMQDSKPNNLSFAQSVQFGQTKQMHTDAVTARLQTGEMSLFPSTVATRVVPLQAGGRTNGKPSNNFAPNSNS